MKNIKVFATAAILSVTVASAAFAGGPTILDADLQPAVDVPAAGGSLGGAALPILGGLLLLGALAGGSSSTATTSSGS